VKIWRGFRVEAGLPIVASPAANSPNLLSYLALTSHKVDLGFHWVQANRLTFRRNKTDSSSSFNDFGINK